MSCEAKVSLLNGGKPPPCSDAGTCSVVSICLLFGAIAGSKTCLPKRIRGRIRRRVAACAGLDRVRSENEQEQQRDQQREDAKCFRHREAENEIAELALGGGRIAQRGCEIVAEDGA